MARRSVARGPVTLPGGVKAYQGVRVEALCPSPTIVPDEDVDVFKEDGTPLFKVRRRALPLWVVQNGFWALLPAARPTDNRGAAGGLDGQDAAPRVVLGEGRVRTRRKKRDGTLSNYLYGHRAVESGIVGYYDRSLRFPYCRMTAYFLKNPERLEGVWPLLWRLDRFFAEVCPSRHAAQKAHVMQAHESFRFGDLAFTTITVNKNFATRCHRDRGDFRGGFGVMTVVRQGEFAGGELIFPRFNVGVSLRTGDVLFSDVHEWHGNRELLMESDPNAVRLSLVLYARERIHKCLSPEEELSLVRERRQGDPL